MSIDTIIKKTGRKIASAGLAGILGLGALGASVVPAYSQSQQKEKYATRVNVNYIPCMPEQTDGGENWGQLLTVLGGVIPGLSNKPEAEILGEAATRLGVMEHQKEVAREGRSQVTINQDGTNNAGQNNGLEKYLPAPGCVWANPESSNDFSVRPSLGIPFAARYWKDLNYNKIMDPGEIIEGDGSFYDNEDISLGLNPRFVKSVEWELYGPNGDEIRKGKISKESYINWNPQTDFRGHGTYTIVWRYKTTRTTALSEDKTFKNITEIKKFEIVPYSK